MKIKYDLEPREYFIDPMNSTDNENIIQLKLGIDWYRDKWESEDRHNIVQIGNVLGMYGYCESNTVELCKFKDDNSIEKGFAVFVVNGDGIMLTLPDRRFYMESKDDELNIKLINFLNITWLCSYKMICLFTGILSLKITNSIIIEMTISRLHFKNYILPNLSIVV